MKIVFRFKGGFRNGTELIGETGVNNSAAAYPFLSSNGTVGEIVREMPPERQKQIDKLLNPLMGTSDYDDAWDCLREFADRISSSPRFGEMESGDIILEALRDFRERFSRNIDMETINRIQQIKMVAYEVVDRTESEDQIVVTINYLGDVEFRAT